MALTVRAGAKDFHTAQKLTPSRMSSEKIDSHHVFPKAQLKTASGGKWASRSELILNRALIDRDTNRIISAKPPSQYMGEIRSAYTETKVTDVLASHLIDGGDASALIHDDYEGFLQYRLERAIELIEEATGAAVTRETAAEAS